MEATLGISLYSYPISIRKNTLSLLLLLMSSLQQNGRKEQSRFCLEVREVEEERGGEGQVGEMVPTMYRHMNK
jgi:hypothetical protein